MKTLEIHVLDVGSADAVLIVYRDGAYQHTTLIDAATRQHTDQLIAACWAYAGGVVDLLVLTHPDGDHLGGVDDLVSRVEVRSVLADDPQLVFQQYGRRLENAERPIRERVDCLRAGAEVVEKLGVGRPVWTPQPGFRPAPHVVVLGPADRFWWACMAGRVPQPLDLDSPPWAPSLDAQIDVDDDASPINQSSAIIGVEFSGRRFLFTGDAGQAALLDVARYWPGIAAVDWLQVPHHGSRHNLSSGLIRKLRPSVAVVSADAGDDDHPHPGVIRGFNAVGTQVHGTRGREFAWWSDGVLRPGFVRAQPIIAPLPNAIFRALLGAS